MRLALLSSEVPLPAAAAGFGAPSARSAVVFTSEWPDAVLDELRQEGDPRWDQLWRGLDRPTFERLLSLDLRNGEPLPPGLPPELVRFFEETEVLPLWADAERLRRGQELFFRYGLPIITILLCASLPECYAAVSGASILGLSTNLKAHPEQRIMQTAQFVLDVMAPGGLEPGGRGIRRTQQVRLLHVVCRHGFLRHGGYRREWGLPLNQEDLLGTLLSFSAIVLAALPRLGIELTEEEQEDYLHVWQVIGSILGIREDQLPGSAAAAQDLVKRIRERHFTNERAANPAGEALATALVRSLQERLPFTLLDGLVPVLMRHLIGDPVSDALGIPASDWTRLFLAPGRGAGRVGDFLGDRSLLLRTLAAWLGRRVLSIAHSAGSGGVPQHFTVPAELQRALGLKKRGAGPRIS